MTDNRLIRRARRGEPEAIRELYRRHAGRVHAVARRLVGEEEGAGDCAQEAWIRILDGLEGFRGDAALSSWIHRIAVNASLDWLRREGPRREREDPLPDSLPDRPRGRDVLLASRIEAALDRVPDRQRIVLVLHDVEGWTHGDIAEALGVAPGTSKSQLHRARARMREILPDGVAPGGESAPTRPSTASASPSTAPPSSQPAARPSARIE